MSCSLNSSHKIILWHQLLIINYIVGIYTILNSKKTYVKYILIFHFITFTVYLLTVNIYTNKTSLRYTILDVLHNCIKISNLLLLLNYNKLLTINGIILLFTIQVSWIIFNYNCPMMMFYTDNSKITLKSKIFVPLYTIIQIIKLMFLL